MKTRLNFLLILLFICSFFGVAGAALHNPGADASVYETYTPYLSVDDSGLNSAYAAITDPKGEYGQARADYNGGVHVRSNSSIISADGSYGFGNTVNSRASQRTIFDITSSSLSQGTQVTGTVNIYLDGRIVNIGNKSYGNGTINLGVTHGDLHGINSLFTGHLTMNQTAKITYTGFNNFGVLPIALVSGNPTLFFDFSTTAQFTGYVGEQFSIEYLLQAQSSLVYDVDFYDTGTFNISFDGGQDAFAQVVPQSTVPVPSAIWLFASGLLGLIKLKNFKPHKMIF